MLDVLFVSVLYRGHFTREREVVIPYDASEDGSRCAEAE